MFHPQSIADTKVGNAFVQGLSGGQKKRLSVALALVKKVCLVYSLKSNGNM